MIFDPSWLEERPDPAPVVDSVLQQLESICGSAFSLDSDELAQVANAVDDALMLCEGDVAVNADTVVRLASQALKAIGETQAGLRLFLFGSGVVKPLEWEVAGGDTLWALDVDHIARGHVMDCELMLYPAVNAILSAICDVWDASRGHGMLGLLHTRHASSHALGAELKHACEARLSRIAVTREWHEQPHVLNLDLGVSVQAKLKRHGRQHI